MPNLTDRPEVQIQTPGRPAKLLLCIGPCASEKHTRDFPYRSNLCHECRRVAQDIRRAEREKTKAVEAEAKETRRVAREAQKQVKATEKSIRAANGAAGHVGGHAEALQALVEANALHALRASIKAMVPPPCTCCFSFQGIELDPIGARPFCPVCMFGVVKGGCCTFHQDKQVFYPGMNVQELPPVPAALLHLCDMEPFDVEAELAKRAAQHRALQDAGVEADEP